MHTCDGCVYLGRDGYTCLRDEATEMAAKRLERKKKNKKAGLLDRLLGVFRKEGKQ